MDSMAGYVITQESQGINLLQCNDSKITSSIRSSGEFQGIDRTGENGDNRGIAIALLSYLCLLCFLLLRKSYHEPLFSYVNLLNFP